MATLPFRHRNKTGNPTYFKEKIICALDALNEFQGRQSQYAGFTPKLHTIREDPNNLWQAGRHIHFVYHNRTKLRECFAEALCVSVQQISITHSSDNGKFQKQFNKTAKVWIDGRLITVFEMEELAKNDGFASAEDFFGWFSEDFTGKIIHWTDIEY